MLHCVAYVYAGVFWAGNQGNHQKGLSSEFMGKMIQAAQLTHERTVFDHRSLLQNIFLISTKLNFHGPLVLYMTFCTTLQRSMEVLYGRYQKNTLQERSRVKNLSCVSCAA